MEAVPAQWVGGSTNETACGILLGPDGHGSELAAKAPAGFTGVLTRKEWKGVIEFVHALNGELVTSLSVDIVERWR